MTQIAIGQIFLFKILPTQVGAAQVRFLLPRRRSKVRGVAGTRLLGVFRWRLVGAIRWGRLIGRLIAGLSGLLIGRRCVSTRGLAAAGLAAARLAAARLAITGLAVAGLGVGRLGLVGRIGRWVSAMGIWTLGRLVGVVGTLGRLVAGFGVRRLWLILPRLRLSRLMLSRIFVGMPEAIACLVEFFDFFFCFLLQPSVILRHAIGMPHKNQVLICLVHLFQRCARF